MTPEGTENNIQQIQWSEQNILLNDLKPLERNPRTITAAQYDKLKNSLASSVGQFRPLLVTHELRLAGGHQRLRAMKELGWHACRVSVPDRPITDEEYNQILYEDNISRGEFDWDIVSADVELEWLHSMGIAMEVPTIESNSQPGKYMVCCPNCKENFPVKGNKAKEQ